MVERQFDVKFRVVHSDNGMEFNGIGELFSHNGILLHHNKMGGLSANTIIN